MIYFRCSGGYLIHGVISGSVVYKPLVDEMEQKKMGERKKKRYFLVLVHFYSLFSFCVGGESIVSSPFEIMAFNTVLSQVAAAVFVIVPVLAGSGRSG